MALQGQGADAYREAAGAILCDCGCHPQSVEACACSRAEEMREAIAAEAASGRSGEEIIAGYVARHGEKILVVPATHGFNLVAWLGPGVALILAVAGVLAVARRWRRAALSHPDPDLPPDATPDAEAYRLRLRREIEEAS